MGAKIVWVVSERPDLQRFLETLLGSHGYQVRLIPDGPSALAALGRGEVPDLLLSDDPPPGLPRATLEARFHEVSPLVRCLFLRESFEQTLPDEVRRFATDDFTMNSPELLELVESLTAETGREITPPPGTIRTVDANGALLRTLGTFVGLLERYEFLNGGNGPLVQRYAVEVAREMGLSASRVEAIAAASLLYDIGMMRVRPEVKLKTTVLTPDDLDLIRQHPRHSAEFCQSLRLPWDITRYVLHHHERYDGRGYPNGLAGRSIPIGARIIAVGDAYFAMISKRAMREAMSEEEAQKELARQAGHQFDPEVVEAWTSLIQTRFLGESAEAESQSALKRVALVDDDQELGVLLESRFAASGYHLVTVMDGGHTLQRLADLKPEAIIVRADLPSIDVLQLLHHVRQEPRLGAVPFFLVSGAATGYAERARALAAGADDFIELPCPLQELMARIHSAIRRKSRITGQDFVRPAISAGGVRGRLADMGLAEICQLLSHGFKTAKVTIEEAGGSSELYFHEGRLKHVARGAAEGADAFYSLLRVQEGEFAIEHGLHPPKETVHDRLEFLLMEGMRLMDEAARGQAEAG